MQLQKILYQLRPIVAKVLRVSDDNLKDGSPLVEFGLSSVMTLVLIQKINKHFELQLQDEWPIHPSLQSLAQLINRKLVEIPRDSNELIE